MRTWALTALLAAAIAAAGTSQALAAARPVPSLTPGATQALWDRLVAKQRARPRVLQVSADCRSLRGVFYAQSDWLRLATKLASAPSPCAQYYISVPPLTGDKTQARANQAKLIRALGPSFHALDEINYAAWSAWVPANGGDWYAAGIEARRRMAAAGFDVGQGDTWALNEVSSAVRKGTGTARQNLLDFLRGLHDGEGAPVQGIAFSTGIGQTAPGIATYKVNLQGWLQDSDFWSAVGADVVDWLQEDYGDVRAYAVAGTTAQQRRDALEQYLGHVLALADAGGDATATARSYLQASFGPLANGAWAWGASYGWTSVPAPQMQDYVSAQVYAARAFDAAAAAPVDRFGFAWAPSNTLGLSAADFAAQTGSILDRLAAAIRDSATTIDPTDPGIGACGPLGQNLWCATVFDGSVFPTVWQGFSTWSQTGLGFTTPPVTLAAGAAAGPLTVSSLTAGIATPAPADEPVTLTTTSSHGQFSTSPSGPWTPSLIATIPAGATGTSFYYTDTTAGTATLSAALPGQPAATQPATVTAGPLATLAIASGTASFSPGTARTLAAAGADTYGNALAATVTWSLAPASAGRLSATTGPSTTFTAGTVAGKATVRAVSGPLIASAVLTVLPPPVRVHSIGVKMVNGHVIVTVKVVDGKRPAIRTRVALRVRRGSSIVAKLTARTGPRGQVVWRSRSRLPQGRYVATAKVLSSPSTAARTQQPAR